MYLQPHRLQCIRTSRKRLLPLSFYIQYVVPLAINLRVEPALISNTENQPNRNSSAFTLGQNLLTLSSNGNQNNNNKYWLKIEEVDASSGNTTGNWFSTEQFIVIFPAAGATSSTMPSSAISTPSPSAAVVTTVTTVTAVGSEQPTRSTSAVSTTIMITPVSLSLSGTEAGQSATNTAASPSATATAASQSTTAAAASQSTTAAAASQSNSSSPSSSGYSESDKIALGVGIGVGLPATLATIVTLWILCLKGKR